MTRNRIFPLLWSALLFYVEVSAGGGANNGGFPGPNSGGFEVPNSGGFPLPNSGGLVVPNFGGLGGANAGGGRGGGGAYDGGLEVPNSGGLAAPYFGGLVGTNAGGANAGGGGGGPQWNGENNIIGGDRANDGGFARPNSFAFRFPNDGAAGGAGGGGANDGSFGGANAGGGGGGEKVVWVPGKGDSIGSWQYSVPGNGGKFKGPGKRKGLEIGGGKGDGPAPTAKGGPGKRKGFDKGLGTGDVKEGGPAKNKGEQTWWNVPSVPENKGEQTWWNVPSVPENKGEQTWWNVPSVPDMSTIKQIPDNLKTKMAKIKNMAATKLAEVQMLGPKVYMEKIKGVGEKMLDLLDKQGIVSKDKAMEYMKSMDMDNLKEMFKSVMKEWLTTYFDGWKDWMEKAGIPQYMQVILGDDCDVNAVAHRNMGKFKDIAKSVAEQVPMPWFIKDMGSKLKDVASEQQLPLM